MRTLYIVTLPTSFRYWTNELPQDLTDLEVIRISPSYVAEYDHNTGTWIAMDNVCDSKICTGKGKLFQEITLQRYINHKTGEVIETEMTEEDALKRLPASSNFAQDLKKKYEERDGALSENQLFWLMKLAGAAEQFFECDTSEIFDRLNKVKKLYVKHKEAGVNIVIYSNGKIWANEKELGQYVSAGLKIRDSCKADPEIIHKFLLVFAAEGIDNCLKRIGIRTGCCCYCGLMLTHEISIECGYGPTCAKNNDLPFPYEDYEKSLRNQRKRSQE